MCRGQSKMVGEEASQASDAFKRRVSSFFSFFFSACYHFCIQGFTL